MISTKTLEQKINQLINSGNLSELQITQLLGAVQSLNDSSFLTVDAVENLPDLESNLGRLVYVSGEEKFYFGDTTSWRADLNSTFLAFNIAAYAWGSNTNGRLGDGTTVAKTSPITVIGDITNWSQVSGGNNHSLGLTDDGIAYAWGRNTNGQLGDGTTVAKNSPITVIGDITNWSQVSGGADHSLGLTDDGIAYAWGSNIQGRLGDGTTIARSSPVTVVGGITNWSQVSAGKSGHSLGLTDDGIAYAWGRNLTGDLGDGTTVSKSSPVTVIGGITNWSQVSAGFNHSLGLTDDGIAYAWGANTNGRLGDGTTVAKSSPITVIGDITNWSQLSAGNAHSLGLTDDGIAYAWGSNIQGRLGDGTTTSRTSPITVIGGITNWSQLSGGAIHSLGLTDDGIAYAWGNNTNGRLGDGTTVAKSSPITVIGDITNWSQVSAGAYHSLGIETILRKGF